MTHDGKIFSFCFISRKRVGRIRRTKLPDKVTEFIERSSKD